VETFYKFFIKSLAVKPQVLEHLVSFAKRCSASLVAKQQAQRALAVKLQAFEALLPSQEHERVSVLKN